jgi:probable rRNA maturation factor
MAAVNYFFQDTSSFKIPFPRKTSAWIQAAVKKEKHKLTELNFIFCSDKELLKINQEYLNHDTYTDIITFDNSDGSGRIEGDIFISIERVTDNANKLKTKFQDELNRVMIHGVLHLLGFSDKTDANKKEMRKKEDVYLSLRDFMK